MAKALLGHVSGPNQRMAAELHRLRQRVCDLEARVGRLQEERAGRLAMVRALAGRFPGSPAAPQKTQQETNCGSWPS